MNDQIDENELWEHNEAAKKVAAQYANRIFVQPLAEGTVRISFGEMTDSIDPIYHTSIVATPEIAIEFAEVIHRVARQMLKTQMEMAEREAHERIIAKNLAGVAPMGEPGAASVPAGATKTDGD